MCTGSVLIASRQLLLILACMCLVSDHEWNYSAENKHIRVSKLCWWRGKQDDEKAEGLFVYWLTVVTLALRQMLQHWVVISFAPVMSNSPKKKMILSVPETIWFNIIGFSLLQPENKSDWDHIGCKCKAIIWQWLQLFCGSDFVICIAFWWNWSANKAKKLWKWTRDWLEMARKFSLEPVFVNSV